MNDVLVILVTHNSAAFIASAVTSCLRQHLSVCVIDNASSDATLAATPKHSDVRVIASAVNLGFAGGVNRAVRETEARLYLLLNPDTELLGPIWPLVSAVVANRHSAAAGLLVNPDGSAQKGFSFRRLPTATTLAFEVLGINRIWPANPVNRWYRCLDLDPMQSQEIEQPAGACLLFRRVDWERLGGFDEGFDPVWFEDVDFCRRLSDIGGTIWFTPQVQLRHHGGHSVQKIEVGLRRSIWYASLLRYTAKHFRPMSRRIVAVAVAWAVIPRTVLTRDGEQIRSKIDCIRFVWKLAGRCFREGVSTANHPKQ